MRDLIFRSVLTLLLTMISTGPLSAQLVQLSAGGLNSEVTNWLLSPDARTVVYEQDAEIGLSFALWSVSTDGSAPTRLTVSGVVDRAQFSITEDGQTVIYRGPYEDPMIDEIYSVPIDGPPEAAVKLSGGGSALLIGSVDGKVVYQESDGTTTNIYRVSAQGPSTSRELLAQDVAPQAVPKLAGSSLFYFKGGMNRLDLAQQPPVTVQLTSPDFSFFTFSLSPEAERAFFNDGDNLWSVSYDGPASTIVNLTGSLALDGWTLSPNGEWAVFRAENSSWYSVPTAGPATAAELIITATNQGRTPTITGDNETVLYLAPGTAPLDLKAVPIEGPLSATETISSEPNNGLGVLSWSDSGEGGFVVMQESRVVDEISAGYRLPLDNLQATSELIWTILIDARRWILHPNGREILIQGFNAGSPSGGDIRYWTANLTGTPQTEQQILQSSVDLPPNFVASTIPRYGGNDIFFLAFDSPYSELFFISRPMFSDGFETGDTGAWQGTSD